MIAVLPLLVFMAVVWITKNAVEDVAFASRGQVSPRRTYRQQRWAARQKRTGQRVPRASGFWRAGPHHRHLDEGRSLARPGPAYGMSRGRTRGFHGDARDPYARDAVVGNGTALGGGSVRSYAQPVATDEEHDWELPLPRQVGS